MHAPDAGVMLTAVALRYPPGWLFPVGALAVAALLTIVFGVFGVNQWGDGDQSMSTALTGGIVGFLGTSVVYLVIMMVMGVSNAGVIESHYGVSRLDDWSKTDGESGTPFIIDRDNVNEQVVFRSDNRTFAGHIRVTSGRATLYVRNDQKKDVEYATGVTVLPADVLKGDPKIPTTSKDGTGSGASKDSKGKDGGGTGIYDYGSPDGDRVLGR